MSTLTPRIELRPDEMLAPADVVTSIRTRRGGQLLNLDRMLLTSPNYAVGWNTFLGAVRTGLGLNARLRELAICAVAVLNRADYELVQHAPEFLACGGTQAQLDALQDYDRALLDTACFDEAELATLALTREMTCQVQVPVACFSRLQQALPNQQHQVEMVGVIAAYNMVSRFLEALQVPAE
jgi:alkylhydroperoxidase family enzyme